MSLQEAHSRIIKVDEDLQTVKRGTDVIFHFSLFSKGEPYFDYENSYPAVIRYIYTGRYDAVEPSARADEWSTEDTNESALTLIVSDASTGSRIGNDDSKDSDVDGEGPSEDKSCIEELYRHAAVYILADKWEVAGLPLHAKVRFKFVLDGLSTRSETAVLLDYVLENTMPSDKLLRPVMISYYSVKADGLLAKNGDFTQVLLKHSDFTVPLMKASLWYKTTAAAINRTFLEDDIAEKDEKLDDMESDLNMANLELEEKEVELERSRRTALDLSWKVNQTKVLLGQLPCRDCTKHITVGRLYMKDDWKSIRCSHCHKTHAS